MLASLSNDFLRLRATKAMPYVLKINACKAFYINNKLTCLVPLISVLLLMLLSKQSMAGSVDNAVAATNYTFQGGYLYQFSADIDEGGDFNAERFFLQGAVNHAFSRQFFAGISIGGGQDDYDFSGSTGMGGLDPWSNIRNLRISVPLSYSPEGSWRYLVIPSLRYAYEKDASVSESQTWGVLAGASYRVNESLSIGPGIGVFSQLEDDASIFPILLINWQITPTLSLDTGRGFAATQGPGLQLNWQVSSEWKLSLGGRYEKLRFRLDKKDIAVNGVGEDKSVPLFVAAEYRVNSDTVISGLLGADVGGSLRVEDRNGNRLMSSDYDPAPIAALVLKIKL